MRFMTPKSTAYCLSVDCDFMSKILHEYFCLYSFLKSEFGWFEKQYLQ